MRTRLILGIVAVVVLLPQAALAFCMVQPFDQVVRSSDAVLVATVAEATATTRRSGIILRLDVEQALKGSAEDGLQVRVSPCGPVIVGRGAKDLARQMEGARGLYLLSESPNGTFSQYSEITTPPMTLDERIARARQVLGLPPEVIPAALPTTGRSLVTEVLIAFGVGVSIAGAIYLARRAARA